MRIFIAGAAAMILGLLGLPGSAAAQSSGMASFAALHDTLEGVHEPGAIRARLAAESKGSSDGQRVRAALLLRRLGVLERDRAPLDESLRRLARVAEAGRDWIVPWFEIGVTKLTLHDEGYPVKEGPWQRLGSDYLHGAADAFVRALDVVPDDEASAVLLAATVLRETVAQDAEGALSALRRSTAANPSSPVLHLARAHVEALARNGTEAIKALASFLRTGGDTGIANVELARLLALTDSPERAVAAYYLGAAFASSPEVRSEYRSDIAWIAGAEQLARFDALPADSIRPWLQRFWGRRGAREGRAQGERVVEHFQRLDYVFWHFRTTLEPRQRGSTSTGNNPGAGLRAISIPPGDLRGLRRTAGRIDDPDGVLGAMRGETLLNSYRSTQQVIDDRGVIYLRFGPPHERATYNDQQTDANESWKYLTPSGPLIFHFIGSVAPTRLVEQLPLDHLLLGSRGQLDPRYDDMARDVRAGGRHLRPDMLAEDRLRNAEAIRIGTTTDAFPLRFERSLGAVIQAYGVARLRSSARGAIVAFAARARNLPPERVADDSLLAYPIRLRITAERLGDGQVVERDTLRTFVTRRRLGDEEYLTGQATLELSPGVYDVRVVLSDRERASGVALLRDSIVVPDLDARQLAASDLVLGRAGAGQRIVVAGEPVDLNPLGTWPTGGTVTLYYQLGGLERGESLRTGIALRRRYAENRDAGVSLMFSERATSDVMTFTRTLTLEAVPPGDYEVVVTVRAQDGGIVVRRQRLLVTE